MGSASPSVGRSGEMNTPGSPAELPKSTPKFIGLNFDRMPAELKGRNNWVLWVPVWTGSKWTKRPVQPSGYAASTKNPKHWCSFDDVRRGYEQAAERG